MKIKHLALGILVLAGASASAQTHKKAVSPAATSTAIARPKLVVGIVIDQMRWDYLYRYYDRYQAGGFKRMLNEGSYWIWSEDVFIYDMNKPFVPLIDLNLLLKDEELENKTITSQGS